MEWNQIILRDAIFSDEDLITAFFFFLSGSAETIARFPLEIYSNIDHRENSPQHPIQGVVLYLLQLFWITQARIFRP